MQAERKVGEQVQAGTLVAGEQAGKLVEERPVDKQVAGEKVED